MELNKLRSEFSEMLGTSFSLAPLFEYIPDLYMVVKNQRGQFLYASSNLAELFDIESPEFMLGKTDFDHSPEDLALQYIEKDERVKKTLLSEINQPWIHRMPNRQLGWCLATTIPILGCPDSQGTSQAVGVAVTMRSFQNFDKTYVHFSPIKKVTDYMLSHFEETLSMEILAEIAHLSVSQLTRRFKQTLQTTPQKFLIQVRLKAASRLLVETDRTIINIAFDTGFYDQSHFCNKFRSVFGLTPNEYRKKYAK